MGPSASSCSRRRCRRRCTTNHVPDALVQLKFVGDRYPGGSGGRSLRNGGTVADLVLESHARRPTSVDRDRHGPADVAGCRVLHHLRWRAGEDALTSHVLPAQRRPRTGERGTAVVVLSSPSDALRRRRHPGRPGPATGCARVVGGRAAGLRPRSRTSPRTAWQGWVRALRFGQNRVVAGARVLPDAFVEDVRRGVLGGCRSPPASWQIELGRLDGALSISAGWPTASRGTGSRPRRGGRRSQRPPRHPHGGAGVCRRRGAPADRGAPSFLDVPAVEEDLPVVFNEYCPTWVHPRRIPCGHRGPSRRQGGHLPRHRLRRVQGRRCAVVNGHGDWVLDRRAFPDGSVRRSTTSGPRHGPRDLVRVRDPRRGVDRGEHGGPPAHPRRGPPRCRPPLWDFRDPFVIAYLKERVIDFLRTTASAT